MYELGKELGEGSGFALGGLYVKGVLADESSVVSRS